MGILQEARAARDAGSLWRARDLLTDHVEHERDPEALALLGEVLHDMGDLPRAGAVWFAAGATGPDVDSAVGAWRQQTGDDFAAMWHSLPASVQAEPRARRVEALRSRALDAGADVGSVLDPPTDDVGDLRDIQARFQDPVEEPAEGGHDAAWLMAWILAVAFVVFAAIGFVTALGWLFPD